MTIESTVKIKITGDFSDYEDRDSIIEELVEQVMDENGFDVYVDVVKYEESE